MSDDEIAAVLAHETAHVLANHVREKRSTFSLASVLLAPLITVFVIAKIFGLVETNGTADPMLLIHRVCMYLRRRQEEEADHIGTWLMVDAGFDPSAAVSIVKKIKNLEDQALRDNPKIQRAPEGMNTHPDVS